ncbi:hypothetical protein GHT06_018804 [Daphnia sinensis]|uniref:Uncharacterized protein n=1 Tax=Daphnia sinensis TaxID=1820382 RepID=A0AAD5PUX5_9CRUS|nr:hypothetical protein GHT06_018804 [Daphnia sinensis]
MCVGKRMAFRRKAKWWKIPNEKMHTERRIGKKKVPIFKGRPHPDSAVSCVQCFGCNRLCMGEITG